MEFEEEKEGRTSSGLIIPDKAWTRQRSGMVVAAGSDENFHSKVRVGNRILFAKNGEEEIQMEDTDYRTVWSSEILSVFKN